MSSNSSTTSTGAASTTARGRIAEGLAADFLSAQGYTILDRNWRNRWCELDIVARTNPPLPGSGLTAEIHFIEVKYRRNTAFGYAAEYISRDKTSRLIRAAAAWSQAKNYDGPYQIGLVTVEGDLQHPAVVYLPGAIAG